MPATLVRDVDALIDLGVPPRGETGRDLPCDGEGYAVEDEADCIATGHPTGRSIRCSIPAITALPGILHRCSRMLGYYRVVSP